jgi:MinD-like ATPase involved in chromosome partitioning or flagellar assembly
VATPVRVGVAGIRAGQGATGYAAALAWSSAHDRATMLIDADGAGGTIASVLGVNDTRSLANVYSPHGVTTAELESQAITIASRPRLRVVPGFRDPGRPGSYTAHVLQAAIDGLPEDLVVVDIGAPFAYPDLVDRDRSAEAVAAAFHSLLIVLRVESDLLENAVRVLRALRIPRARIVLVRPAHRRGMTEARALLIEALPTYPIAAEWEWDSDRCVAARARGEPMSHELMAEELGLFGRGHIVHVRKRARLWPLIGSRGGEVPR